MDFCNLAEILFVMKFRLLLILFLVVLTSGIYPQEKVNNLILMIPDGTSSSVLALARWYRFGSCAADNCRLAIDPHICGLVSTYNSDSPIGDSAPTGSTYATGTLSNTGFVATYPLSSGKDKDLVIVDPLRAYHPLITILEAAKLMGKSTGLVMTSEFTHATPADFSSHTYDRNNKEEIALQMVHNNLNVVFGGGLQYLDPSCRKDGLDLFSILRSRNYKLATTIEQFETLSPSDSLTYGLFSENYLPNHLDRDPYKVPSLEEMTRKAIRILSGNPEGFFLMVEGSKIDWSAHQNDPVGTITEFLAFDDAVKAAMEFAGKDGYTAVVVVPDHGTSGISIGNARSDKSYDNLPLGGLTDPLQACKRTAEGISRLIHDNPVNARELFLENTGIRLSDEEVNRVVEAANVTDQNLLSDIVSRLISKNTYVGFTTKGHTGEDVVLAVYHPGNFRPEGVIKNTELNHYMTEILNMPDLNSLTETRFCIDTAALEGMDWEIVRSDLTRPKLLIRADKSGKIRAEIESSTDYITIFKKDKPVKVIPVHSLAIFVEPLGHFFVPKNMENILTEEFLR